MIIILLVTIIYETIYRYGKIGYCDSNQKPQLKYKQSKKNTL